MTTPAQQAKDFAAANGFTIVPVGRRYLVTHAATGATFERGGYPACLKEMQAMADAKSLDLTIDNMIRTGTLALTMPAVIANAEREHIAKWPWALYVSGRRVGSFGNRTEAVTRARRDYNSMLRDGYVIDRAAKWDVLIINEAR